MKNKKSLLFAIGAFFLSNFDLMGQNQLSGTWVRDKDFLEMPTVVIFGADNRYEISSGAIMVVGTYKIEGNTLRITDAQGQFADTKSGDGVYTIEMVGNSLKLVASGDAAAQRRDILVSSGFRKN